MVYSKIIITRYRGTASGCAEVEKDMGFKEQTVMIMNKGEISKRLYSQWMILQIYGIEDSFLFLMLGKVS